MKIDNYILPLSKDFIKDYLPHRDPMLFIDNVISLEENQIIAESFVDPKADYFKGHFPDMPVMPGVLIIESVAQAGALLVSLTRGLTEGKFIAFSSVEKVKFRHSVLPREKITIHVEIEKIRLPFYKFKGVARVQNKVCSTLIFSAAEMSNK